MDWEVQREGRENGFKCCGGCHHRSCWRGARWGDTILLRNLNKAGTAICQRCSNMQSSHYLLPNLSSEDSCSPCWSRAQVYCVVCGFTLIALHYLYFLGWFWMGDSFSLQLPRALLPWCIQMDLLEDSGSSLYPTEEELGDRFCLYFRGLVVKGRCYLKSPFKKSVAGRNKYNVRNYRHERGTAGVGLLAIYTCSLVSTWVCLGSLLELGEC